MLQACAVSVRIGRPSQHLELCDQMLGLGLDLGLPQPSARRTTSIKIEAIIRLPRARLVQVMQHNAQRLLSASSADAPRSTQHADQLHCASA